jgi:DNA polymerase-3 subunit gamma/tau
MWQMLLKALEEVAAAPTPMMAAEMAVIRLTHVADLPDPERLLRRLGEMGDAVEAGQPIPRAPGPGAAAPVAQAQATVTVARGPVLSSGAATAPAQAPDTALARFARFEDVVDLIRANRDVKLLVEVETHLRLARYTPGRIEFEPTPQAPRDLAATLAARLQGWTGQRWGVSVVGEGGGQTIAEKRDADRLAAEAEMLRNPLVQAVIAAFPGARITDIRTGAETLAEAAEAALPEVEDEWDPFEKD